MTSCFGILKLPAGCGSDRHGLQLPAVPARTAGPADHCRTRLASFKIPKQLVIRDSLPRNPSGKVLKRVLRVELEGADDAETF